MVQAAKKRTKMLIKKLTHSQSWHTSTTAVTQLTADTYAINHCNKLEFELVDHYYPDDEQYPYIAKWVNNQGSRRT